MQGTRSSHPAFTTQRQAALLSLTRGTTRTAARTLYNWIEQDEAFAEAEYLVYACAMKAMEDPSYLCALSHRDGPRHPPGHGCPLRYD